MIKKLNKIEKLIDELCPDGVEFKELGEVCLSISAGGDLPKEYTKGQNTPTSNFPYPIYSNGSDEKALYGYTNNYKIDSEAVTVSARGTIGYHAVRDAKFTPIVRLITLIPDTEIITVIFLNYVLDITEIGHSGGSIPQLTVPNIKKIKIPIPPLAVQEEIVKILDSFTQLEAELEAELEARKKQYEYYREKLLTFGDDVEFKELGEVASLITKGTTPKSYKQSGISFIKTEAFDGTQIDKSKLSYIDEITHQTFLKRSILETDDILFTIAGATIGKSIIVTENILPANTNQALAIIRLTQKVNRKYIFYMLKSNHMRKYINQSAKGSAQPNLNLRQINDFSIPIPPLSEQKRIVLILDKFDALVNDISTGLPAELNARRKQYEYYRNQLLTFKPLERHNVN